MQAAPRVQFRQTRHRLVCTITDSTAKTPKSRTLTLTGLIDGDHSVELASAEITIGQRPPAHLRNTLIIHYPSSWGGQVEAKLPSRRPAAWFATRDPLIPRLMHEVRLPTRSARFRADAVIVLIHSICEVESRHMAQS